MGFQLKIVLAVAASTLAFAAAPAQAVSTVSVVATDCISVAHADGCLFTGNIAPGTVQDTEDAYNAYNNLVLTAQPDIDLSFITKSDDGNFGSTFGGSVSGSTSGTWSLPGYLVNFIAVKASNNFVLYQITPASSGNWDTFDIPFNRNPHELSHLAFFGEAGTVVPEPATWGMMILGIGMIGGILRRRQRRTVSYNFA